MGQQTLVEYTQCRTNEVCTMYIEEFILVDVVTLLYMDEHCTALYCTRNWTLNEPLEECWFIYTRNKGMRYVRITLRMYN